MFVFSNRDKELTVNTNCEDECKKTIKQVKKIDSYLTLIGNLTCANKVTLITDKYDGSLRLSLSQ